MCLQYKLLSISFHVYIWNKLIILCYFFSRVLQGLVILERSNVRILTICLSGESIITGNPTLEVMVSIAKPLSYVKILKWYKSFIEGYACKYYVLTKIAWTKIFKLVLLSVAASVTEEQNFFILVNICFGLKVSNHHCRDSTLKIWRHLHLY